MSDYGNGLFLDTNFDFTVGADGDLAVARNESELRKDIAFRVAGVLETGRGVEAPSTVANGVVGSILTRGLRRDAENAVASVVDDDPRVDRVDAVRVSDTNERNTIAVDLRVIAAETPLDISLIVGESS